MLSRNQRAVNGNGFKVKHALQVLLLLAFCTWVLYQVRHKDVAGDGGSDDRRIKFGRKELRPRPVNVGREEKEDVPGEDLEEMEVEGRGVWDDEIDINDLEIVEEADAANEFGEYFGDEEVEETEDGDESSATETGRGDGEEKEDQTDGILQDRRKGNVASDASSHSSS